MKIRPVGADLFHADGRTDVRMERRRRKDGQIWRSYQLFFEILRMCLKVDISGCCGTLKSQIICTNVEMNLLKQTEENKIAITSIIRPKVIIYVYIQW